MAAHMISIARREYTADWGYASSNGASRGTNGQATSSGSSYSTSSISSAESEAAQPEPLRSGIATMEPDEGGLLTPVEALISSRCHLIHITDGQCMTPLSVTCLK